MSSVSGGPPSSSYVYILMGVSGSGKSTIGESLSSQLRLHFTDGDHLHPQANLDKMSAKVPLTDEDRRPWLENIHNLIHKLNADNTNSVIVCSALKKRYRDVLREGNRVRFIYLKTEFNVILERLRRREGHFMPVELLESQFQTLEEPDVNVETDVTVVSVDEPLEKVVAKCSAIVGKQV